MVLDAEVNITVGSHILSMKFAAFLQEVQMFAESVPKCVCCRFLAAVMP